MKRTIALTVIILIAACTFCQNQIDATEKFGLQSIVKKNSFIRIKQGTPVYQTKKLTGIIIYEYKKDTVIKPSYYSNMYFLIDSLGYISPKAYILNTFYSTALDSIVSRKLTAINSIKSIGILDSTLIKMHSPIEFTVDTTYTNYSKLGLRFNDSYLFIKKAIGSFYLAHNDKIYDKIFT
jgi:hypothetical protein